MKLSLAVLTAALALASAALAKGPPPAKSGSVAHSAYTVCRALGAVDLGEVGSNTSADCTGIVRVKDRTSPFDNLALHCLEESVARKDGYKFTGTCVETDADGDKLFLAYEGPESGPLDVLGGTGKFAGLKGRGKWTVADTPGNTASLFAFTLDYSFDYSIE